MSHHRPFSRFPRAPTLEESVGRDAYNYAMLAMESLQPGERRTRILEALCAFEEGQHVVLLVRAVRN